MTNVCGNRVQPPLEPVYRHDGPVRVAIPHVRSIKKTPVPVPAPVYPHELIAEKVKLQTHINAEFQRKDDEFAAFEHQKRVEESRIEQELMAREYHLEQERHRLEAQKKAELKALEEETRMRTWQHEQELARLEVQKRMEEQMMEAELIRAEAERRAHIEKEEREKRMADLREQMERKRDEARKAADKRRKEIEEEMRKIKEEKEAWAKDSIYVASALIALINERDQLCCNIICKQRILCWSQTVDSKKLFAEIDKGRDGYLIPKELDEWGAKIPNVSWPHLVKLWNNGADGNAPDHRQRLFFDEFNSNLTGGFANPISVSHHVDEYGTPFVTDSAPLYKSTEHKKKFEGQKTAHLVDVLQESSKLAVLNTKVLTDDNAKKLWRALCPPGSDAIKIQVIKDWLLDSSNFDIPVKEIEGLFGCRDGNDLTSQHFFDVIAQDP